MLEHIQTLRKIAKKYNLKVKKSSNSLGVFVEILNFDKTKSSGSVLFNDEKSSQFIQSLNSLRSDDDFKILLDNLKTIKHLYLQF